MGKMSKQVQAQLLAAITAMQNPKNNEAQNFLTTEAMAGADVLKKGDYSQLPKGMFFNFKSPIEEMKQYDNLQNVGAEGTYALGDNEGAGKAMALAGDYRKNMFANQRANNYQDNVSNAATNIRAGLGQAAGAKGETDRAVIDSLQSFYGSIPKTSGFMSVLGPALGMAGQLGAAAITAGGSTAATAAAKKFI